tara:strand:+ start:67 stop:294 length:228 start_codon:yes stop_codon:yes gene_type:complete
MTKHKPGDFVACYLTNNEVYEELLTWGIVIEVSETLKDILVLERTGESNWWPQHRWTRLEAEERREISKITGILA